MADLLHPCRALQPSKKLLHTAVLRTVVDQTPAVMWCGDRRVADCHKSTYIHKTAAMQHPASSGDDRRAGFETSDFWARDSESRSSAETLEFTYKVG